MSDYITALRRALEAFRAEFHRARYQQRRRREFNNTGGF